MAKKKQEYVPQGKGLDEPGATRNGTEARSSGGLVIGKKADSWLTKYKKDQKNKLVGDEEEKSAKKNQKTNKSNLAADIVGHLGKSAGEFGMGVGGVFQGIARVPEQISRSLFNQSATNASNSLTGNKLPTDKYGNVDITSKKPEVFGIPHSELAAKILYGNDPIKTYQQQSSDVEKATSKSKNKTIKDASKYSPFLQPILAAADATAFSGTGVAVKEGSRGTLKSLLKGESRVKLKPKTAKDDKPPLPEMSQEEVGAFKPKQIGVSSAPSEPGSVRVRTPNKPASEIPEYQAPEPKLPTSFKELHGKEAIIKNDAGKAIKIKVSADGKSFKLAENLVHDGNIIAKKGASEINGVPNMLGDLGEDFLKKGKIEPVHAPPPEAIDKNFAFGETDHRLSRPREAPPKAEPPTPENPKPGDRKLNPHAVEYAHSVKHPDDIVNQTADAWHGYDKTAKGGQLIDTAGADAAYHNPGGMKRISDHTNFYREYFAKHKQPPSKAAYRQEVRKQIEAGGGDMVERDIADAHGLAASNHAAASATVEPAKQFDGMTTTQVQDAVGHNRPADVLQTKIEKARAEGDNHTATELEKQLPDQAMNPDARMSPGAKAAAMEKMQGGRLKPLAATETSEKGTSKLATSVQSKALKEKLISKTEAEVENLPQYNKANMKEQADFATKLINEDPKKAIDIALGRAEPPAHILPQMVYNAVEDHAIKMGGKEGGQLLKDLAASKRVSDLTVMAQNVRAAGERDPHSAVNMINDVATTRAKIAESRLKKSIAKTEQEDRVAIKAATPKASKYDWESFINSIEC